MERSKNGHDIDSPLHIHPGQALDSGNTAAATSTEKEQVGREDVGATTLDPDVPVTQRHLTFNTQLPCPVTAGHPDLDPDAIAPCPDLARYTSPLRWGHARKNVLLLLSCVATFLTAYSAGAYSPPSKLMAQDLDADNLAVLVGITTFCLGFALAPMVMAPVSEIWGRRPVFLISGVVYVVFQLVCGFMPDLAGMLVARFLVGMGSSVFSAVVGGVIADLWEKEERNTPMALFSGAVLAGTGTGPLVSAALVETVGDGTLAWKWSFWHQVIMDGLLVLAIVLFFSETRGSVILRRKADALNKWYGELEAMGIYDFCGLEVETHRNERSSESSTWETMVAPETTVRRLRWVIKEDEDRASLFKMIVTSMQRPFYLLFTEPVVFCFSLWAAFSWGVLYLSFSVVPYLFSGNFEQSSSVYVAMIASAAVATSVGLAQEQLLSHRGWRTDCDVSRPDTGFWAFMRRKFPPDAPEARLYFACINTLLLPAGLFGAFMGPPSMTSYSIAVGLGFATWGIYSVYLATFNYLADTYHIYASSALAAQSCCRNLLGGSFPLITGAMFGNLGLKGAGAVLGGIAAALTAIPWVLVFYGETIRSRSSFAISLQKGI